MSFNVREDPVFKLSGDIYIDMLLYLAYEAHKDSPDDRWLNGRYHGHLTQYVYHTKMSTVHVQGNLLAHYSLICKLRDKRELALENV